MKPMDKLKDMICSELEEIEGKGEMSAGDLDAVYKLIVAKEKLLRIEELEEDLGYSEDGGWKASGTYSRGSYDGGNSYRNGGGYSGRARHYVRGHYSRGRYSMAEAKDDMVQQIQEMMDSGELSQAERSDLQKAMRILEK